MLDGIRATKNFRDGFWQGFYGENLKAIIDLGADEQIQKVTFGLLQNHDSWIIMPKKISLLSPDDLHEFNLDDSINLGKLVRDFGIKKKDFDLHPKKRTRYLKVVPESIGNCPPWHNGNGYPSWIFADEIILGKAN